MKKFIILFAFFAIALSAMTSCQKKQVVEEVQTVCEMPAVAPYQPVHFMDTLKLKDLNCYTYFNAPTEEVPKSVTVKYDTKYPYTAPIIVCYTYQNGDTYTYIVPEEFGLRTNEIGRFKIIQDDELTVWMQGQTSNGRFYEFVFYGNEKFNSVKIKPNSHYNHPHGVIKYCY